MNIPNFFIIGAPKCGTTALSEYLRDHPDIFVTVPKEPHFFATDFDEYRRVKTWDDYQTLFSNTNSNHAAVGEASVWYLYSAVAVKEIFDFNCEAKLIILLRNPIDMLISLHAQLIYTFFEDQQDFEGAWRLQSARANGSNIPSTCPEPSFLHYRQVGRLGNQVSRVLSIFPREQVKLILHDDFASDTRQIYEEVLQFLDVPSDGRTTFPPINVRRQHRVKWAGKLLYHPPFPINILENSLKDLLKRYGKRRVELWHRIMRLNAKPVQRETLSPDFRLELINEFREDVQCLSRILGTDLHHWYI